MSRRFHARRIGDHVPVLVKAADGWVIVWHTPQEFADLWEGVDEEAASDQG